MLELTISFVFGATLIISLAVSLVLIIQYTKEQFKDKHE